MPACELLGTLIVLFAPCELSGRISTEFEQINYHIDQFDWYLFSLDMKKMLIIIMANAQQPVDVGGFGSFPCNRETFEKVRDTRGYYYYLDKWTLNLLIYFF